MNLETLLDPRLWQAIDNCYANRNYTGCIIDAIHYLGNLLREKTGLQSDGVVLVGEALGGKSPKLKVNKFETESDINEQKGIEQILRGIYQAIRNPRSHEKRIDDKIDAEAIIIFLNYLIKLIDKSKSPFTMESFLERVFEPDFVEKARYAELLIDEIPIKKRFEVFVEVFRIKTTGDGNKLRLFFNAISRVLNDEEINQVTEIISEELKYTNDDQVVRTILQCLPPEWWNRYIEVSRLRIENKLIQSIRDGSYDIKSGKCLGGWLGAWAKNFLCYFALKTDLVIALGGKLRSSNKHEQDYVFAFFFPKIFDLSDKPSVSIISAINNGLKKGDIRFYNSLRSVMESNDYQGWQKILKPTYDSFVEIAPQFEISDDDIPF